jgi:serine/threonine-protein kinase RsbT
MTLLAIDPVDAPGMTADTRVDIETDDDVVAARRSSRRLATRLGFTTGEATLVVTAVSELARNIVVHATRGEIILRPLDDGNRNGVLMIARDHGPGIPDVQRVLRGGYSTSGGTGTGLAGMRRMADEFAIASAVGSGTGVIVTVWSRTERTR